MATKPAAAGDTATAEQDADTTLLDVQSAAMKRLLAKGKERGYITFDELNLVIPQDQNSSEQIEDLMSSISEMGIQVVEGEESEDGEAPVAKVEKEEGEPEEGEPAGNVDESNLGRTDDPVRMYLREMGSVELLSREGEIAIAKRIEAGRDMMIGGPLRKPADLPRHRQLARPAEGRQDAAARHHRPGGDPGHRRRDRGRRRQPPRTRPPKPPPART